MRLHDVLAWLGLAEKPAKLGWLSSWNSKCGIAEYSRFLLDLVDKRKFDVTILASKEDQTLGPDGANVVRCWTHRWGPSDELLAQIEQRRFDVLVMQFNYGFLHFDHLRQIIELCRRLGTKVFLTFHRTTDVEMDGRKWSLREIADALGQADRLLVHSGGDLRRLQAIGLGDKTELFPHGLPQLPAVDKRSARRELGLPQEARVVGAFGFLLPHKGIEPLIEAFALWRKETDRLMLVNALYPIPESAALAERCKALIAERGLTDHVTFENGFLSLEDSNLRLSACDLVVFPYQQTEESSSAAVRTGLASRRPALCTPLGIFEDVADIALFTEGTAPAQIAAALDKFYADQSGWEALRQRQDKWLADHSWQRVADLLQERIR